jgi:hypothetical protein
MRMLDAIESAPERAVLGAQSTKRQPWLICMRSPALQPTANSAGSADSTSAGGLFQGFTARRSAKLRPVGPKALDRPMVSLIGGHAGEQFSDKETRAKARIS